MKLPPLFNPSNDMALAANVRQYSPPRRIQQMEEDLRDLAQYWKEGPWGWSLATKQRYLRMGVPESQLPCDEQLSEIRRLSSRAFACEYAKGISQEACGVHVFKPCMARFCTNLDEVKDSMANSQCSIIKSPWSSSGRGNMVVCEPVKNFDQLLKHRIEHIIRKQGGVVVEPFYADKQQDFAMEFWVDDEGVQFLGYSVFSADKTGHYYGNYVESQEMLLERIALPVPLLQNLIEHHRCELAKLDYRGPVGIDMMKLKSGVHPCVEINFRMTMGLLAILLNNKGACNDQLLTPNRTHGFVCLIRDGRLMIDYRP